MLSAVYDGGGWHKDGPIVSTHNYADADNVYVIFVICHFDDLICLKLENKCGNCDGGKLN